jgi:hypothetical protein
MNYNDFTRGWLLLVVFLSIVLNGLADGYKTRHIGDNQNDKLGYKYKRLYAMTIGVLLTLVFFNLKNVGVTGIIWGGELILDFFIFIGAYTAMRFGFFDLAHNIALKKKTERDENGKVTMVGGLFYLGDVDRGDKSYKKWFATPFRRGLFFFIKIVIGCIGAYVIKSLYFYVHV